MNEIVHFRRKLLDFDRPINGPIVDHLIPRYYSNFFPWFRTYNNPPCGRSPICTPTYKEILQYPTKLKFLPNYKFKVNWVLVVVVMYLLFLTIM